MILLTAEQKQQLRTDLVARFRAEIFDRATKILEQSVGPIDSPLNASREDRNSAMIAAILETMCEWRAADVEEITARR